MLTSLRLSCVPPDLSVQIFIQCPNLAEFHYSDPERGPSQGEVSLSSPFSSKFLVDFHLETCSSPWMHALIKCLHAPALRTIHWDAFDDSNHGNRNIRGFFKRLPPTLTTIVLEDVTSHLKFIPDHSNIENLELWDCTQSEIRTLFRKLTPILREGRTVPVNPLPRLKRISISTQAELEKLPQRYSVKLAELFEHRLNDANNSFVFQEDRDNSNWARGARARLWDLIAKGYRIRIIKRLSQEHFMPWDV